MCKFNDVILLHSVSFLSYRNCDNSSSPYDTLLPISLRHQLFRLTLDVAAKKLPNYIPVPISPGDLSLLKKVPDLTGYEDLHGKEFTVSMEDFERREAWCSDKPLALMIPRFDRDVSLNAKVRAEGYPDTIKMLTIPMMHNRILIEDFHEQSKIKIQYLG